MNKQRRNRLCLINEKLESLAEEIQDILDEEQENYDNLPEQLQETEKGETMYDNINDLEEVLSYLEDQTGTIQDIIDR